MIEKAKTEESGQIYARSEKSWRKVVRNLCENRVLHGRVNQSLFDACNTTKSISKDALSLHARVKDIVES